MAPRLAVLTGALSTTPIPISRKRPVRTFLRWPGLFIQARTMARGVLRSPEPQARFSPIIQLRAPLR